jgi:outer membrane immunogenic protein
MKKLLLSGVAFAVLAMGPALGPVMAADLSAPIYKALPPPPAPAFSWSGCYIGGTVGGGYAWSQNTNTVNTTAFGDFGPTQGFAQPTSGFAGGGQLGCNYQISRFVVGIEGSYLGANIKGDYNSPFGGRDDVYTNKIDTIATVVARFGWAFDNWLYYTKIGWAGAHAKLSVADGIAPVGAGSASNWHNGFTIGSGVEYAVTRNWILGFESNYYRFESKSYEIGGGNGFYTFDSRPRDVYSFLGRLSFKFDMGGPVVANY